MPARDNIRRGDLIVATIHQVSPRLKFLARCDSCQGAEAASVRSSAARLARCFRAAR
jgi:hypothetical protein